MSNLPVSEIASIHEHLAAWSPSDGELDELWTRAKLSLDEVTHLTEYEDEKANRILAAMSFQSALAGLAFAGTLATLTQTHVLSYRLLGPDCIAAAVRSLGILAALGPFALYCYFLTRGAFEVVSAVAPWFNEPKEWQSAGGKPRSYLFYARIVEVSPVDWARAFTTPSIKDLQRSFIKNAIFESYLIADKIKIKLRLLDQGIGYLQNATRVLMWWLPLIGFGAVLLYALGGR